MKRAAISSPISEPSSKRTATEENVKILFLLVPVLIDNVRDAQDISDEGNVGTDLLEMISYVEGSAKPYLGLDALLAKYFDDYEPFITKQLPSYPPFAYILRYLSDDLDEMKAPKFLPEHIRNAPRSDLGLWQAELVDGRCCQIEGPFKEVRTVQFDPLLVEDQAKKDEEASSAEEDGEDD